MTLQADTKRFLLLTAVDSTELGGDVKPGNTFFNTIHFGKHVSQISALLVNLKLQVTCISQNVQGRGKAFRKGVIQPRGKKNHKQDLVTL